MYIQDDETMHHGANCLIECLVHTLSNLEAAGSLPAHLCVQSDNTVAWSKNSAFHVFMAMMAMRHKFSSCSVNYLVTGHTHEDVDRLFSEILPVLKRKHFNSMSDIEALLKEALQTRATALDEKLQVKHVTKIHNFEQWLNKMGVSLYNTFKSRGGNVISTAHSFCYMRRVDLAPSERVQISPSDLSGDDSDVFAIVKTRMFDEAEFAHPPVLVLPKSKEALLDNVGSIPVSHPQDT